MKRLESRMWWASVLTLALTLAVLPWCLGGTLPLANWVLLFGAGLATLFWLVDLARFRRHPRIHLVLLPLAIICVTNGVQLIPLPPGVLSVLSPRVNELRDFALLPLELTSWRPLTHDVPSSLVALGRDLGLLLVLWLALQLGKEKRAQLVIATSICVSGALLAVCGLVHRLLGTEVLLGLHTFWAPPVLITPFGNTNHLAAYEAFTSVVAIALAMNATTRERALGWGAVALLSGVTVFLTMSRGGIAVSIVVLLIVVGLVAIKDRSMLLVPAVVVMLGFALSVALAWEPLKERIDTVSSTEKLQRTKISTWPMMFTSAAASWPLGMGNGAFELALTRDQVQQLDVTFTHPENIVLQWLANWGFPVALTCFFILAFAFFKVWLACRNDLSERVLLFAVLGAAGHDFFDFALELTALLPAVLAILALVAGRRANDTASTRIPLLATALGALVLLGLLTLRGGSPTFRDTEKRLADLNASGATTEAMRKEIVAAIDRHPADWVLYASMAERSAADRKPQDTLAWVNRVIFLRPLDARSHNLAGDALTMMNARTQALLEYKLAFSQGNWRALQTALDLCMPHDDCERVLTPSPDFVVYSKKLLTKGERPDLEPLKRFLRMVIANTENDEQRVKATEVLGDALLYEGDAAGALKVLSTVPDEPMVPEVVRLRARALSMQKNYDEALKLLQALVAAASDDVPSVFALAETAAAAGQMQRAHDALKRALPLVQTLQARADIYQRQAQLYEDEGHWTNAADAWTTAIRLQPAETGLQYRLATAYEKQGALRQAYDVLVRARATDGVQKAKRTDEWFERLKEQIQQKR